MKNANSLIFTILIFQIGISAANDTPFEFVYENKVITEIEQSDAYKRGQIYSNLKNMCPFETTENPEIQSKILLNQNLDTASKMTDSEKGECIQTVQDMNDGAVELNRMTMYLNDKASKLSDAEKKSKQEVVEKMLLYNKSLSIIFERDCDIKNSTVVASKFQHVLALVETVSAAAAVFNPVIGAFGAGVSAISKNNSGIRRFFSKNKEKNPGEDIKNSESFLSDLCTFRNLTYQYDDVTNAILNIPEAPEQLSPEEIASEKDANQKAKDAKIAELKIQKESLDANLNSMNDLIMCTQNIQNSINQLQIFADQLIKFTKNPASQLECFNILNNYMASKKMPALSPLDTLAKRYHCSNPEEITEEERNIYFCNNYQSIEEMVQGDFVTKCEDAAFQNAVTLKFTSLTLIISQNIQKDLSAKAPADAKIKDAKSKSDQNKNDIQTLEDSAVAVVIEDQSAITSLAFINRTRNANSSKSIENIGRSLLGPRFDLFAHKSLQEAEHDIKEGKKVVEKLVKEKNKIDGVNYSSSKKVNRPDKQSVINRICAVAAQVESQFISGYKSSVGVKDVCDFTRGRGVPPLKSNGETFDSYSASAINSDKNMTSKCSKIDARVASHVNTINQQMSVISGLGCVK